MNWQVQEAKQRLSEVLRAAEREGAQTITRHGQEVAVVVDIAEYRRMIRSRPNLTDLLLGPPYLDDETANVFDEIEAERKNDLAREFDFGAEA